MKLLELLFKANTSDLDTAAKKLDKIGDEAKDAAKETRSLGAALDNFSGLDGPIGSIASQIKGVRENAATALAGVQNLTAGIGGVAASVPLIAGAVTALAGAGGIIAAFNFAGPLDDIGDLAAKLGLSADQATILSSALTAAGTSIETYYSGIDKVAKALTKADEEGSKANEALAKLGVNVEEGAKPLDVLNRLTEDYGKKLSEGTISTDEMAALQLILGKNYRELIVATTAANEAQAEANRLYELGIGISEQGSKAAGDLEKAQLGISHILKVVGSQLVRDIIPTFTALINQFRESYEQGGLVKIAFEGIKLAADVLMIPIKLLTNAFIYLETTLLSIGKAIGAIFASIATRSMDPIRQMNEEVKQLLLNAADRVGKNDLFGQNNNNDTVQAPRALDIGASSPSAPKATKDKNKAKTSGGLDNGSYQDGRLARESAENQMQATKVLFMYSEEARKAEEATQKLLRTYVDMGNPLNNLVKQQLEIESLMERFPERADELYNAWLKIQESIDKTTKTTSKAAVENFDIMQRVGLTAFKSLEDGITSLAMGGKFSFKSFVQSLIADLIRLTFQLMVIKPLMEGLARGAGTGGVAGWIGTIAKLALTASAKGNVFQGGGVTPFANGGVVSAPTVFPMRNGAGLMGEAGPEGILPLKRNGKGQLGVMAQGMGGGSVANQFNINVTVQGGETNEETGAMTAKAIRQQIEAVSSRVFDNKMKQRRLAVGATA